MNGLVGESVANESKVPISTQTRVLDRRKVPIFAARVPVNFQLKLQKM